MKTKQKGITVAEWVAELRSGKYQQGIECLHHNGRYCCLGVGMQSAGFDPRSFGSLSLPNEPFLLDLPAEMEVEGYNVEVSGGEVVSALNDAGWSFEKIADAIEQAYLKAVAL